MAEFNLAEKINTEIKKYELPEEEQMIVSDTTSEYNRTMSTLDALWTLVLNQAEDVQRSLEQRLHNLLAQRKELSMPYTAEELHERIALSEEQFSQGQCLSHTEVQDKVNNLFESWN